MRFRKLFLFSCIACAFSLGYADSDVSKESREQMTPQGWSAVQLPTIAPITANNTVTPDLVGDNADNAAAINAAIYQASRLVDASGKKGGMVVIPAGTWLSGPIVMKSNVVFHLSAGATLKMLPYGQVNGVGPTNSNGYYPASELKDGKYSFPVFISSASWKESESKYSTASIENVIVEGEGETSVIDGDGAAWWEAYKDLGTRPGLIRFGKGTNFLFRNFKMQNAPGTNLTLGQSGNASNFTVHDVTIVNPSSKAEEAKADGFTNPDGSGMPSHNTDGIPVWGPYVNIYHCNISTGDDNVVFDSNSQYCHVWDCDFGRGHGASMGSYTEKMHDILWEDITFNGTASGFRMKSNSDRSGEVYNITMRNCTMENITENPISINMWYDESIWPTDDKCVNDAVTTATMNWHNITLQNITSTGTNYTSSSQKRGFPIHVFGRKNAPIHDLVFDNVHVEAAKGMQLAYCNDIVFKNGCKIINTAQPGNVLESTSASYAYVGSLDGSADPTYDDPAKLGDVFSLVAMVTGSDVKVPALTTVQLYSPNVSISGGQAEFYNGHDDEPEYSGASMITPKGFSLNSSSASYLKITLDQPIAKGDLLITTGQDGGVVSLDALTKDAADNIDNNIFTFTSDYAGKNVIYIARGSKKPTFTSVSVVKIPSIKASVKSQSAEGKFWNFSDWDLATFTSETTIDGLTIKAAVGKEVTIDSQSAKIIDGISFTNRLKFGGTGNENNRHVQFPILGTCTITVYVAHAGDGEPRPLILSFGSFGSSTQSRNISTGNPVVVSFDYEGGATTAYLYSGNSGLNIYGIKVTYPATEAEYKEVPLAKTDGAYSYDGEIVIKDGEEFYASLPFTASKVSYSRAMSNEWGTLCLPFALTVRDPEEQPYDFFVVESADKETGVITLTKVQPGTLPAGTPVVVYRNAGESGISFTETNVQIVRGPVLDLTATAGLTLVGTFRPTTLQKNKGYYIASNKFWKATKEIAVAAFRSYFFGDLEDSANSASSLRIQIAEGEASGIENTPAAQTMSEGVLYSLDGQAVKSAPQPNQIYLLNGHKVMFK